MISDLELKNLLESKQNYKENFIYLIESKRRNNKNNTTIRNKMELKEISKSQTSIDVPRYLKCLKL